MYTPSTIHQWTQWTEGDAHAEYTDAKTAEAIKALAP